MTTEEAASEVPQHPAVSRRLVPGYLLLVAALALLCGLRKVQDWDLFWHLRTAAEALRLHSTLQRDTFSYSVPGAPWPYKDLLAEIILYGGFSRLGYAWFAGLRAAVVALIAASLWLALPPGRRSPTAWILGLGLFVLSISYRIADRPLLFSLALFPLLLALLERARRAATQTAPPALLAAFAPLVALQAVWFQLHREAMVGLVVLCGFALYLLGARVLRRWWPVAPLPAPLPSFRAVGAAALALLIAASLGLFNLCGLAFYRTSLTAITVISWQEKVIIEWQTMGLGQLLDILPITTLVCLGAPVLWLGAVLRARRQRSAAPSADREARSAAVIDIWHLGCWLLFAYQTHRSVRWLPFLAAVSVLIWLLCAQSLCDALRTGGKALPRGLDLLLGIAAIALVGATHPQPYGLGEAPEHFPSSALAFAERHGLHEKVANAFPFGGYILWHAWPRFKVLVDGRNDLVYQPDFMLACNRAERDPEEFRRMRAAYGADWVLAGNRAEALSHRFLVHEPDWALVHYSGTASVYVLRSAYPQLRDLELRYVPLLQQDQKLSQVLSRARAEPQGVALLERELRRIIDETPRDLSGHVWLSQLYQELGPAFAEKQAEVLRHLLLMRPELPAFSE